MSKSPWRNRLARSAVNRKVGGSSPPGDGLLFFLHFLVPHQGSVSSCRDGMLIFYQGSRWFHRHGLGEELKAYSQCRRNLISAFCVLRTLRIPALRSDDSQCSQNAAQESKKKMRELQLPTS